MPFITYRFSLKRSPNSREINQPVVEMADCTKEKAAFRQPSVRRDVNRTFIYISYVLSEIHFQRIAVTSLL